MNNAFEDIALSLHIWLTKLMDNLSTPHIDSAPYGEAKKRRRKTNPDQRTDLPLYRQALLFNGLWWYLVAYVFTYLPGQLTSVLLASVAEKAPVLFHHKLLYMVVVGWDRFDAVSIYGGAIFINLLQFLIYLGVYDRVKRKPGHWRMLAFWLLMHAANRFFGCVIPGIASNESFKYVADWMYWGPYTLFLLALASITVMLILSGYLTRFALQSSSAINLNEAKWRKQFLTSNVLLPWLYGSLIISLSQYPDFKEAMHEISLNFGMILLILPMFFYLKFLVGKPVPSTRNDQSLQRNYKLALYGLVFFGAFRWFLGQGIYF